jgi:hypothetical protein
MKGLGMLLLMMVIGGLIEPEQVQFKLVLVMEPVLANLTKMEVVLGITYM